MNGYHGDLLWKYEDSGVLGNYLGLSTTVIPASALGTQRSHGAFKSPAFKSSWLQPPFLSMWREERAGKDKHVDLGRWKQHENQKHMGSLVSFPISLTAGMIYKRPSQVSSQCSRPRGGKGRGGRRRSHLLAPFPPSWDSHCLLAGHRWPWLSL